MDNSKIIHAAHDILSCVEIPFRLIVHDERTLKVLNSGSTTFCKSVTCRFDAEATDCMRVSFNDEPQLEENTAVLSGTCYARSGIMKYFDIELDNGGRYRVYWSDSANEHFQAKLQTGDKLKIRASFEFSGLTARTLGDILSHTREETVQLI